MKKTLFLVLFCMQIFRLNGMFNQKMQGFRSACWHKPYQAYLNNEKSCNLGFGINGAIGTALSAYIAWNSYVAKKYDQQKIEQKEQIIEEKERQLRLQDARMLALERRIESLENNKKWRWF